MNNTKSICHDPESQLFLPLWQQKKKEKKQIKAVHKSFASQRLWSAFELGEHLKQAFEFLSILSYSIFLVSDIALAF